MQRQFDMSAGELRFIEPYLEKTCFVCAKKGAFRRHKSKLLICECNTVFSPMPDGSLAIFQHAPKPVEGTPPAIIVPA